MFTSWHRLGRKTIIFSYQSISMRRHRRVYISLILSCLCTAENKKLKKLKLKTGVRTHAERLAKTIFITYTLSHVWYTIYIYIYIRHPRREINSKTNVPNQSNVFINCSSKKKNLSSIVAVDCWQNRNSSVAQYQSIPEFVPQQNIVTYIHDYSILSSIWIGSVRCVTSSSYIFVYTSVICHKDRNLHANITHTHTPRVRNMSMYRSEFHRFVWIFQFIYMAYLIGNFRMPAMRQHRQTYLLHRIYTRMKWGTWDDRHNTV